LVKVLPWQKVVAVVFHGSGECAKVSWRFLSLSIAAWSAITFAVTWIIIVVSFISFLRDR
jgi:Disulfide bond formation protein DsbB.